MSAGGDRGPATGAPPALDHLHRLRGLELDLVAGLLPAGATVLEIGAGTGAQARDLDRLGFGVSAIDLADSIYAASQVWPVQPYDGHRIPFLDASFDAVFSSSELEHIPHVEAFQAEIRRVLRPGGMAIHGMPTTAWRWGTLMTHYPALLKRAALAVAGRLQPRRAAAAASADAPARTAPARARWRVLIPERHGETGHALSELWHFRAGRWRNLFARTGWRVEREVPNGLWYTGQCLVGLALPIGVRRSLAAFLDSACRFYVLRPR